MAVCEKMLAGKTPYIEGSIIVLRLKTQLNGLADHDEDFSAFEAIASETDHLPLEAQRQFWDGAALKRLEPEYEKTQIWADSFARTYCENLISRFSID